MESAPFKVIENEPTNEKTEIEIWTSDWLINNDRPLSMFTFSNRQIRFQNNWKYEKYNKFRFLTVETMLLVQ